MHWFQGVNQSLIIIWEIRGSEVDGHAAWLARQAPLSQELVLISLLSF